jgi:hypothetical protein
MWKLGGEVARSEDYFGASKREYSRKVWLSFIANYGGELLRSRGL